DEPDDSYPPRLFKLPRHAFDALRWWLAGIASREYTRDPETGYYEDDGIMVAPKTDRVAKDMRVITVTITFPDKDHPHPPLAIK
ncbi:hypothetical protein LCGC14_3074250, partial [marine sediment metagenome]